mmetsp:Transcript_17914/g.58421  ORF Transcript_17914/g.58421 Transcript_17914/m.58421 type:complete len:276 (-) Transcript_17914:208-1035(-)
MLSLTSAPLSLAPTAVMGRASAPKMSFADEFTFDSKPWSSSEIKDKAGLEALAKKLNPTVGLWDPLGIAETSPETIGWFRHAEIKHGRVAMAAFVGYCVQSNGIHFPWNIQGWQGTPVVSFADIAAAGGPADQWDALSTPAKLQILGVIGFLEMWSETSVVLKADGQEHYVRGGKPGYFPTFSANVHPMPLNLFDPFKWSKNASPEKKAKGLVTETNNGRLAMLGLFGFLSESKIPGSVPALSGIIPSYDGDYMQPFLPTGPDTSLWTIGNLWAN